jgi:gliding motility-associated-like protein
MRFYFNGTEYTTNQNEGNHSSSGMFTIGGNQSHSPHNYYRGQIDEVAVWNEALSANEISALYNSGTGLDASSNSGDYTSSSNLVGYFKMDEGSGTTISDSSGNGSSGTLNNMNASSDWIQGGVSVDNTDPTPEISQTKIALDNSIVSVTFSAAVYGGTANSTSTLEVSDFELSISGGSASLSSSTPSSIIVSGTTIGLGIPISGTPDGDEILTILPVSNAILSVSGETVSSTQSSNSSELIPNIINNSLILYLDASNKSSYPGTGTVWYDLSGNNNDFNLNGPTFDLSGFFDFDGTNDYARTVSTLDLSQYDHVTVQINMLAENTNKLELTFEHSENWNSNVGGFGLANQSGASTYINNLHHTNHDRGGIYRNYETNILNEWHQQTNIFSSVDDPTGRLTYIDGNLLNYSVQPSGSYPTGKSTTNSLNFGNYHFYLSSRAGSNYFLNGKVKSILIYGTKLSSDQINQNYDALNDIPPTDISLTSNTISETASIGSLIGTLSATDSDTSINNLSFSFESSGDARDDDNGSFTISGTSLLTSSTLDYETKASYNIYLKVSDGTSDFEKAFTVSVTNVLEPITDLSFAGADFVTDGLILHLDAGNSNSYPGSGSTWFDLSGNNNHATINGPTFSNSQIKHFVFDGSNDDIASMNLSSYTNLTIEVWYYDNKTPGQYDLLTYNGNSGSYTFTNNNFRTDGNGMGAANFNGTSQISNQWVRFVYVKNSKVFINDTPTNKSNGSDNAYGQLKIGDARSDVGQHWDGKIALVRVYNRGLTDQEISKNYDGFNAVINNNQTSSGSSSSISVDEEVSIGTLVGTLTATDSDTTDFTFSLVSGNGTNDQHNSLFTVSGTQLLVAGNIDYETNSTLNIYVQASDGANTYAKALTVNVNDINEPPVITATSLSNDNSSISVTFSKAVNASADASNTLALEVSDFALSINGGTATLSSTTPTSISVNGNTYTLGLPISGAINGSETVTVVPIINSIYDSGATTASTTQSNNTVILHGDTDSDGVNDVLDQCPNTPGGASVDVNGCAESQKDPDNDGITGINDNCPTTANSDQTDTDGDGVGDVCDPDIDGDGIANGSDNCPYDSNPDQKDSDTDGMGDLCDRDNDNDGYDDGADSFPFDPTEWMDSDNDGTGNNADKDDDNDTYLDTEDAFPLNPREWLDTDGDGLGNNADKDDDNDGVEDKDDAFPLDDTENLDTDKDGIGNNTDEDDDGDGYSDLDEIACESDPLKRSRRPEDYDRDLSPDCVDTDDDNDGCLDQEDLFPLNERECIDTDGDGIGDNADMDADNDGIIDSLDDFPTDPNESKDTDGDGIGDNADLDDNNDGFPEDPITNSAGEEVIPIFVSELLTPNQSGEESTWRIVNIDKYPTANVKIYSPTGEIVYESWDYKNDWDGKGKNGESLPTGPYMYMIDRGDETQVEQGWLYIFN